MDKQYRLAVIILLIPLITLTASTLTYFLGYKPEINTVGTPIEPKIETKNTNLIKEDGTKFNLGYDSVDDIYNSKEYVELRQKMLDKNQQLDSIQLIKTLDKFSTTADYDKRVIRMIKKIRKLEESK